MKTATRLPFQAVTAWLVLTLVLNPIGYSQIQEPSRSTEEPPTQGSQPQAGEPRSPADSDTPGAPAAGTEVPAQADDSNLPDSPGSLQTQGTATSTSQAAPQQTPQQPPAQSQANQQPGAEHEPLGTAAAESIPTSGNAASRPAGAALAPAKQKRMRSLLIKVGALVGVGVAVGATLALSQGSPSKPPGSN